MDGSPFGFTLGCSLKCKNLTRTDGSLLNLRWGDGSLLEEVVTTKYKTLFLKIIKQITIEMNTFEYCEVSVFIIFLTY